MPFRAKEKQVGIWNFEGKGSDLRGYGKSKCLVSQCLPRPTETKGHREQVLQSSPTCSLLPAVDTSGDSSIQETGSLSKFFQALGGRE